MPVCGSEVFPIAYEKNEKVLGSCSRIIELIAFVMLLLNVAGTTNSTQLPIITIPFS